MNELKTFLEEEKKDFEKSFSTVYDKDEFPVVGTRDEGEMTFWNTYRVQRWLQEHDTRLINKVLEEVLLEADSWDYEDLATNSPVKLLMKFKETLLNNLTI